MPRRAASRGANWKKAEPDPQEAGSGHRRPEPARERQAGAHTAWRPRAPCGELPGEARGHQGKARRHQEAGGEGVGGQQEADRSGREGNRHVGRGTEEREPLAALRRRGEQDDEPGPGGGEGRVARCLEQAQAEEERHVDGRTHRKGADEQRGGTREHHGACPPAIGGEARGRAAEQRGDAEGGQHEADLLIGQADRGQVAGQRRQQGVEGGKKRDGGRRGDPEAAAGRPGAVDWR